MSGNNFTQADIEDDGGNFYAAFKSLTTGTGSRVDKRLPAPSELPEIPERSGTAPHKTAAASSGGGGINMTLKGAKTVYSTDGLITITYPESAEVIVGTTTITIPAIIKTP